MTANTLRSPPHDPAWCAAFSSVLAEQLEDAYAIHATALMARQTGDERTYLDTEARLGERWRAFFAQPEVAWTHSAGIDWATMGTDFSRKASTWLSAHLRESIGYLCGELGVVSPCMGRDLYRLTLFLSELQAGRLARLGILRALDAVGGGIGTLSMLGAFAGSIATRFADGAGITDRSSRAIALGREMFRAMMYTEMLPALRGAEQTLAKNELLLPGQRAPRLAILKRAIEEYETMMKLHMERPIRTSQRFRSPAHELE